MNEKKYPFPKKTGTLQKHNFKNKLDIFLFLFWARKGIYKYNDKESDDEERKCNYKRAIMEFMKFMHMDNPLMEIMVDEFLEEIYMEIDDE